MLQSVEQTLAGLYVAVDDANYDREVLQAGESVERLRPAMTLFYNDHGEYGSKGGAVLSRLLVENFPEIKFAAYRMSDGKWTPEEVRGHVMKRYGLKNTPAMINYFVKDGAVRYDDQFAGICKSFACVRRNIVGCRDYVASRLG